MYLLASSSETEYSWGVGGGAALLVYLAFIVLVVVGMWKVFTKAGEEGWKAIIPVYNVWVLLKIVGRPGWWLILFLIPVVNIIVWIIVANDISRSFGKGLGFTIGLIFLAPIFILILGLGGARYVGPAGLAIGTPIAPPPPPAAPGGTPPPPPPPHA